MEGSNGSYQQWTKGEIMAGESYVSMLKEGLEKKLHLLDAIISENEKQLDVIRDVNSLPEDLQATIDKKSDLIEEIGKIDDGFEELFERTKKVLESEKVKYKAQISDMQLLIRQISDRTAQIQAQENRNKEQAEDKFTYIKNQIQKVSKSQKAVHSYYNSMMKANYLDPQFMDDKK